MCGALLVLGLSGAFPAQAIAKFIQLDGVMGVKTRFSTGCTSVQDVAELARAGGLDVVIYSDLARDSLEYGLFPFQRVIKQKEARPSILASGATAYLSEINDNDQQLEETLLIGGLEAAPFYYWTGRPFFSDETLVAHNSDKRLMVVGLNDPADIEQLPLLNSNFSKKYIASYQNAFIGYSLLFLISVIVVYKGYYRILFVPLAGGALLLAINNHPFQSSPFDQYHGDAGMAPYQELINYAVNKEAMVFWTHLESAEGIRQEGPVGRETLPHPEDLGQSWGYTGFQGVGLSRGTVIDPGRQWDSALIEYISNTREHPVWIYGAGDYRCGDKGDRMGLVRTIFLVRQKTREAVLDAMRTGRMYAVRTPGEDRLSLDEFRVSDSVTRQSSTLGQEIIATDFPEINARLRSVKGVEKTITLKIIRNGTEVKQETVALPYDLTWRDVEVPKSGKVYYRVIAEAGPEDYLVSNPIFVRFAEKIPEEVASLPAQPVEEPEVVPPAQPTVKQPVVPRVSGVVQPPASRPTVPTESSSVPPPASPAPPAAPKVASPAPPAVTSPATPAGTGQFLIARIDGVSLKKGPGTVFPEVARINKGDRLALVRRTNVKFNGKVWLVVKSGDRMAYVWEGLVEPEPANGG